MQKTLLRRLSSISRVPKKNRMDRFFMHPWKMLCPRVLKMSNGTFEVCALTFWGGKMHVVLPESCSTFVWRYGYYEEDVCLYMLHLLHDGATFIDIGAHFGFFTLFGAYLVGTEGKVLAFEPIPRTYQQLTKNIGRSSNVEACNYAAFSENTERKFYDYGLQLSAYNSAFGMRRRTGFFDYEEVIVRARKVDDVIQEKSYEHVHLIKVDAESSEIQVLKGMKETLNAYRPNIILEVGDFAINGVPRSEEIIKWLEEKGYTAYEVCNGALIRHKRKTHYRYGNLLFRPDKRCE